VNDAYETIFSTPELTGEPDGVEGIEPAETYYGRIAGYLRLVKIL
jgi:hypothetical protein